MTVKELYEQIGGSYDDAISLMRKEERIRKYLGMFLRDGSYQKLSEAMEADDMEAAFNAAHTLKGVCANLSFTRLFDHVSGLTEDLRHGRDIAHAKEVWPTVTARYHETMEALERFLAEN